MSQISIQSSQSDPTAEVPREKSVSLVEAPTQITIEAPLVLYVVFYMDGCSVGTK